MNIELTKPEGESLMQLLDIACGNGQKPGGLQIASLALPLAVKISDALRAEQPATQPEAAE